MVHRLYRAPSILVLLDSKCNTDVQNTNGPLIYSNVRLLILYANQNDTSFLVPYCLGRAYFVLVCIFGKALVCNPSAFTAHLVAISSRMSSITCLSLSKFWGIFRNLRNTRFFIALTSSHIDVRSYYTPAGQANWLKKQCKTSIRT